MNYFCPSNAEHWCGNLLSQHNFLASESITTADISSRVLQNSKPSIAFWNERPLSLFFFLLKEWFVFFSISIRVSAAIVSESCLVELHWSNFNKENTNAFEDQRRVDSQNESGKKNLKASTVVAACCVHDSLMDEFAFCFLPRTSTICSTMICQMKQTGPHSCVHVVSFVSLLWHILGHSRQGWVEKTWVGEIPKSRKRVKVNMLGWLRKLATENTVSCLVRSFTRVKECPSIPDTWMFHPRTWICLLSRNQGSWW